MSSLVRAASLTNYSEIARALGLDPVRMLYDAGLSPSVLRDPDLMIPAVNVGKLLHMSALQSGCETFGLRMAETRLLSNLGAVGLLIRDQATLRDSLMVLTRYQAQLNGALSLAIEESDGVGIIREAGIVSGPHEYTRHRIELVFGVVVRVIRQLLVPEWQPRRVCFEHPAPHDTSAHLRFFGRHVDFGGDFNCIICTKADLDTPNSSADPAMARYAQQLLERSMVPGQATILDEVRRTVLLMLPSGRCGIERVAEHLGVVPRTIQRRLAEEGQSFSAVVNDIRKELAVHHVVESNRPLTEVAALLGFSAPSVFSRWYHSQFGCSAKDSRALGAARRQSDQARRSSPA